MISKPDELIKDSMGQFMIHTINSLKVGGRFGLVIDRGILNNGTEGESWQKKLRQWLLTVCDLQIIILLPKGIFTHTTFDTAIIYGVKKISYIESISETNNPSTNKIVFYNAKFEDEKNKKGIIVELDKQDIQLTLEQLVNKNWSLKYEDYVEKKEDKYEGIEYKTLGEVCKFIKGKVLSSAIVEQNKGEYPVIGGGIKPFGFYNKYNMEEKSIVISQSGANAGYVSRYDSKIWASDCFSISYNNNNYLYYFLKLQQSKFCKKQKEGGLQTGQAQPHVKSTDVEKFKFPILSEDHQSRIVNFMNQQIEEDYTILDRLVQEFKDIDLFKFLLYEDYDTLEVAIKMVKDMMNYEKSGKKCFDIRKRWCFKMVPSEEKNLGEVCEFIRGKALTIEKMKGGNYQVIGGGIGLMDNFYNEYNTIENQIIMSNDGSYAGFLNRFNKKLFITSHCNKCIITNEKMNESYLFYYLKTIQYKLITKEENGGFQKGQAQPSINIPKMYKKIKIPIPSTEDQEKVIQMIESINNEESDFNKSIKAIKQNIKYIYECVEQLIDSSNEEVNNDEEIVEDDEEIVEEENQLEDDEEEITEEEFKEIEVEDKTYYVKANIIYNKKKNGSIGKECGKLTKNGKVKFNDNDIVL
jgi:restriction endonuclease S subunit